MTTRNLYIKPRDENVWQRAEELARELGISLSALTTAAVELYLERDMLSLEKPQALAPGQKPARKNQRVWGEWK